MAARYGSGKIDMNKKGAPSQRELLFGKGDKN
jgi:hypothetical protein